MNVTLRQLQAFVEVAATGNFTRAAERMQVAQPTVSLLIRELEAELGLRLIDRTTRRAELTETGREFRIHADKIVADLHYAVQHASELVERKRGRITLAATPLLAAALIANVITVFKREFPGVQVVLIDTGVDEVVTRVKSGEADIGVVSFRPKDEECVSTPLFRETLVLFCSPKHPLAGLPQVQWRDLAGFPLVALPRNDAIRDLVEHGYKAAGLAAQPAYEVSQIMTALAFVEAGLGVTVLPAYAMASAKFRGIATRPLSNPSVSRDTVIITRRDRSLSLAATDFLRLLRRRAKALKTSSSAA
jgi:DNA-binding transcriptional LysR family regulator